MSQSWPSLATELKFLGLCDVKQCIAQGRSMTVADACLVQACKRVLAQLASQVHTCLAFTLCLGLSNTWCCHCQQERE